MIFIIYLGSHRIKNVLHCTNSHQTQHHNDYIFWVKPFRFVISIKEIIFNFTVLLKLKSHYCSFWRPQMEPLL